VLLVHTWLPEGVTICDVLVFAAMIEEAYHTYGALLLNPPDESGTQLCRALAGNGQWEWRVSSPALPSGTGLPLGPLLRMTLAPEQDGQRTATLATYTVERSGRDVLGPALAALPISIRPPGRPPADSPVELEPLSAIAGRSYRRPPATVPLDELRQSGVPTVLFVNRYLPEGVTVCDIDVFTAMIEEAYHTPGALHMLPDLDEHGNQQCTGIGSTGTWEWLAVSESALNDYGEQQMTANARIGRILFAPEADGKRVCRLYLKNGNGVGWLKGNHPVAFTITTRPGPGRPARDTHAKGPA
jgi:hypothetical protein